MGLLFSTSAKVPALARNRPSDSLLHRLGCTVCPLNKADLCSPKMEASGSEEPLIYCLGEAPGRAEDEEGRQFVGPSGDLIRPIFPARFRSKIRWNNVLNCRPPKNRDPDKVEIEACRSRVVADIERTKPKAIFGFGAVPLGWTGRLWIELWRGRRFPVKIGNHVCWYYAMRHPSFILHMQNESDGRKSGAARDEEWILKRDIERAIDEVTRGLPKPVVHSPEFARSNITCLYGGDGDLDYLLDFLDYAGTCYVAGVDHETQGLRPYRKSAKILTTAVSVEDETVAFAWRHPQARWTEANLERLEKAWVRFLKSKAKKAVHNASFETEWNCFFFGNELARAVPWECTQTQAFVLDERSTTEDNPVKPGALALTFLTQQYYDLDLKKLTPGLKKDNMESEPLSALLPYNGMDSKYHRWVWGVQDDRIESEGLRFQYEEKLRQVPTVVLCQLKGLPVDKDANEILAKEYEKKLVDARSLLMALPEISKFRRITGREFNPASPQDVVVILRDVLQTREGQDGTGWSTSESVLSKIDGKFGTAEIAYRKVLKLKSTYVEPYSDGSPIIYPDGLHGSIGTTFTVTGRLNCEDPNLQNLPIRVAEAKKVRRQISDTSCRGSVVASFDMGQIDGRLIACGSRDPTYVKALWEDYDIHAEWARRLALAWPDFVGGKKGLSDPEVMDHFRGATVKSTWVFALFYGAALFTTAARLRCPEEVLRPLYDEFWKVFAGVKTWQEKIAKQYEELGYVELFNGLRRRGPISHGQKINSPIQGATNRVVMLAMNKLSELEQVLYQANLQLHDDLTFVFRSMREFEDAAPRIVDTMLDAHEFDWICTPLTVDVKVGPNWADQKKVGTFSSHKRLNWPIRAAEFT